MKLFERLTGRRHEVSSGQVAKDRLRQVLAYDRTSISPALLDTLKDEIVTVISRHVVVDTEDVQLTFSQNARETRLLADIPVSGRRGRRNR